MKTLQEDLDLCVRCGLCLAACPTFALTGMEGYSPRGRIAAIKTGDASEVVQEYLDTCLGCRACETVCPSGVPYGRIFEAARAEIPTAPKFKSRVMLWATKRRWRLSLISLPLWLAQKVYAAPKGIPPLRLSNLTRRLSSNYAPSGKRKGSVVLFAGCVQDAWARDVHWATIAVLTRLGYQVRVPQGQVCCGALHAHVGRHRAAVDLAERNIVPLEQFAGTIIVNSAGCGAHLKTYGALLNANERPVAIAGRVRDVLEFIDPVWITSLVPRPPEEFRRVAYHDACHHLNAQRISARPRALLRAASYEVADLGDGGRCCGAAGTFSVEHPDWAAPLLEAKADAVNSVQPDVVAAANPGCAFWMGAAPGMPPVLHPIQLLALALSSSRQKTS